MSGSSPGAGSSPDLVLRIGAEAVAGRGSPPRFDVAELTARIAAHNRRRRLPGLADALDPDLVDPAKAAAFVRGLASQSAPTLARLAGHELPLDWEDLALLIASPTAAADFEAPFALVVDEVQGARIWAHTTAAIDPLRARNGASAARAALAEAHDDVVRLEQDDDASGAAQLAARLRRSAILRSWLLNARAWVAGAPGDRDAAASLAAADALVDSYLVPRGDT